jgi:hypothetical protein
MNFNAFAQTVNAGGRGPLVVTLVAVALLLGALAWWYLRRDDEAPPVTVGQPPSLTLRASAVTRSAVTVEWTFVGNDATYGAYSLTLSDTDGEIATATPSSGSTSHTFEQLQPSTLYTIVMTVTSDLGVVEATTTADTDDLPTAPTLGVFERTATSVTLNWEGTGGNYHVNETSTTSTKTWDASTSSLQVDDLTSNTSYVFHVVETTDDGFQIPSGDLTVSTLVSAPTFDEAEVTADTVTLKWQALDLGGGANDVHHFVVDSLDNGGVWTEVLRVDIEILEGTVANLDPYTTYTFRLGTDGDGAWSTPFTVTTAPIPPISTLTQGYADEATNQTIVRCMLEYGPDYHIKCYRMVFSYEEHQPPEPHELEGIYGLRVKAWSSWDPSGGSYQEPDDEFFDQFNDTYGSSTIRNPKTFTFFFPKVITEYIYMEFVLYWVLDGLQYDVHVLGTT